MKASSKWILFSVTVLICMILIAGCDNRSWEAPDIDINIATSYLYNEASGDSIRNSTLIRISLSGDNSVIDNQKIWFDYDGAVGNLFLPDGGIQGDQVFTRTSATGYAEVTFNAFEEQAGVEHFRVYAQNYASSGNEFVISVTDIPEIELDCTTSIVPISSPAETLYVTVVLTSLSANTAYQTIDLTLREQYSDMILTVDSVVTNEHGRGSFEVVAGPNEGLFGVVGTMRTFAFKMDDVEFTHVFPE